MIHNWYAVAGLIMKITAIIIMLWKVLPVQIEEVARPRNNFTGLRQLLLYFDLGITLIFMPGIIRSYQIIFEKSPGIASNIASITTNLGILGIVAVLMLIYSYRGNSSDNGGSDNE